MHAHHLRSLRALLIVSVLLFIFKDVEYEMLQITSVVNKCICHICLHFPGGYFCFQSPPALRAGLLTHPSFLCTHSQLHLMTFSSHSPARPSFSPLCLPERTLHTEWTLWWCLRACDQSHGMSGWGQTIRFQRAGWLSLYSSEVVYLSCNVFTLIYTFHFAFFTLLAGHSSTAHREFSLSPCWAW